MTQITPKQWELIEVILQHPRAYMEFIYKGRKVEAQRRMIKEGKSLLFVYVDGDVSEKWCLPEDERPSIIPEVWKLKTKQKYTAKQRNTIEKMYGKRGAKKEYPDLHDVWEWHSPAFSKASVLCKQFKKLDGITLGDETLKLLKEVEEHEQSK